MSKKEKIWPKFFLIQFIFSSLIILWTYFVGKSMSWDVWNHHIYPAFAWATGRIETDLFAAGAQSYQNPLGYFPFYYMVQANWSAFIIGIVLAVVHSFNIGLLWIIVKFLWKNDKNTDEWCTYAVIFACITPVFLQVAGTSSIDPISSIFILLALIFLFCFNEKRLYQAFICGFFIGLSFSLKQSNAVYGISLACVFIFQILNNRNKIKNFFSYMLGAFSGVVLGMGWLAWMLWFRFGNPIFPLYNNIFKSPYAPQDPILASRFIPTSFSEWIWKIWDFSLVKNLIYTEDFSPDIRPLAFVFMFFLWGLSLSIKKIKNKLDVDKKYFFDHELTLFLFFSYILWMMTSGNGRYGIVIFMLFGVLLVRYIYLCLPCFFARNLIFLIGISQVFVFFVGGELRMQPWAWDSQPYFNVDVPDKLKNEPFLHLTIGTQTYSSIVPFLNTKGVFVNPVGSLSLPMSGPVGDDLQKIFKNWKGNIRLLRPSIRDLDTGVINPEIKKSASVGLSILLSRFDLDVNLDDCEYIKITGEPNHSKFTSFLRKKEKNQSMIELMSCEVNYAKPTNFDWTPQQLIADKVFDFIEKECPMIYGPSGNISERIKNAFSRFYANTDTTVIVSLVDNIVLAVHSRRSTDLLLGSVDDILEKRVVIPCKMWSLRTPD